MYWFASSNGCLQNVILIYIRGPSVRMFYLRITGRFLIEFSTLVSTGGAFGGRL